MAPSRFQLQVLNQPTVHRALSQATMLITDDSDNTMTARHVDMESRILKGGRLILTFV